MKYFYDCEFLEGGPEQPVHLLSIGVVCEDGRELYYQNLDCPLELANDWVKANVFPHLQAVRVVSSGDSPVSYLRDDRYTSGSSIWQPRRTIANKLRHFISDEDVELWGYYADYDHVVLCQLFGSMVNLPSNWPKYTRDLKQLCDQLGNPKLPEQGGTEHDALWDARWNKQVYELLSSHDRRRSAGLDYIAQRYGDLERRRAMVGKEYLTPERVLIGLAEDVFNAKYPNSRALSKHFCPGWGQMDPSHIWAAGPGEGLFERRCELHPDRRQKERRYTNR